MIDLTAFAVAYAYVGGIICPRCAVRIVRPIPASIPFDADNDHCLKELRALYRTRHGLDIDDTDSYDQGYLPSPMGRWGPDGVPGDMHCDTCSECIDHSYCWED
jgi:hypothetical protein